eukprot:5494710-Pleurochrysis_carterae.AAC.1
METRSLTPALPDLSEPCCPRDPVCTVPELKIPPESVMPSMEEGTVDESRSELSAAEAQWVRELAGESLNAEHVHSDVGVATCCQAEITIDEAMAVYRASCMCLGEEEEARAEGMKERPLSMGEESMPTTIGVIDEVLSMTDNSAQDVLGAGAAEARKWEAVERG